MPLQADGLDSDGTRCRGISSVGGEGIKRDLDIAEAVQAIRADIPRPVTAEDVRESVWVILDRYLIDSIGNLL